MHYINDTYINLYEVNKSKFISYLCPYSDFEVTLKQAKQAHPKASHYVWAYRYLKDNILFQKSYDDGEPKGCGGSPILNILQKQNLINTANIIVRYFGGVKLGAGGLIRAYGASIKDVVQIAKLHPYELKEQTTICINISNLGYIKHYLSICKIDIINIKYAQNKAKININSTKINLDKFMKIVKNKLAF